LGILVARYPYRMAEAVLVSVQQVETYDDTGLVRMLLDALAVLAPSGVPGPLLHAVADRYRPQSGRPATERAVGRLVEASMATRMGSDSVAVHRLTQRVVRDRARAEGTLATMAATVGECLEEDRVPLREAWERQGEGSQLVDQIDALWNAVVTDLATLDEPCAARLARLRDWMARYLHEVGESARALDAAEETLSCLETALDVRTEAVLVALESLAVVRGGPAGTRRSSRSAVGCSTWGSGCTAPTPRRRSLHAPSRPGPCACRCSRPAPASSARTTRTYAGTPADSRCSPWPPATCAPRSTPTAAVLPRE
jgi:hypothetical protein